jgi:hypothetical protein
VSLTGKSSRRGVLITVIGDVCLTYLDLRGLQKQLAMARDNLRLQEDTSGVASEMRHRPGQLASLPNRRVCSASSAG